MSPERFMQRVEFEANTGCWLWTGSATELGYGRIVVAGARKPDGRRTQRPIPAHRWSLHLFKGVTLPRGKSGGIVCHKCDTPLCVNPDHLWVGTPKQNIDDMNAKGRHPHPAREVCSRCGHPYTPENIMPVQGSHTCRACYRARLARGRALRAEKRKLVPLRMICSKGHQLTPDNLILKDGRRLCRTCVNVGQRANYQRHKEKLVAQARAKRRERKERPCT